MALHSAAENPSSFRGSGRVPPGFVLEEEETQYRDACGLDLEQMAWRRNKIAELKDPLLFKQEYPATAAEAFQRAGTIPLSRRRP